MTLSNHNQMHKCPYCGYEFDGSADYCQGACPLAKGCNMIMCPNCRYEFVPAESKTINFFKKIFSRSKQSSPSSVSTESKEHVTIAD